MDARCKTTTVHGAPSTRTNQEEEGHRTDDAAHQETEQTTSIRFLIEKKAIQNGLKITGRRPTYLFLIYQEGPHIVSHSCWLHCCE